ncbi:methylmalonyl Co-A mutase-associated GTPase MeaB [Novosphingobium sp. Chol11]|uniref:methylmalonyl Co-A mutase-associated GTPase MeaB n=1 Tax=Novosphingobium sp. Chol11 TaxID=1385763 RepID=UPI0025E39AAF|nr:methylmalonyl Co-A mutase-associated GTPase MeaB [Novosphingobium sp. Chol11]
MSAARKGFDAATLLTGVRRSDTLAISRAITAIENETSAGCELALAVADSRGGCRTIGVTGPPGAGKSSLINALMAELLPRFGRIGVLTVDPSSPVSGGAVLGDRVRMAAYSGNPNVFIRSLASRGHLGGVTRTTRSVIDLLAAGGMDLVIVETVGTGQSEVEVAGLTDLKLVVCAPGLGDEMQAIKAGVLEIADLLVVNKADLPDAERTMMHLKAMLGYRGHDERRAALKVSSMRGEGLTELAEAIAARLAQSVVTSTPERRMHPRLRLAEDVAALAAALVREGANPELDALAEAAATGALPRHDAVMAALRALAEREITVAPLR